MTLFPKFYDIRMSLKEETVVNLHTENLKLNAYVSTGNCNSHERGINRKWV